jgi:uncharacterized RDD family membrane protein YckC
MAERFRNRTKRLARRVEREKFDTMVMPAAFFCLPLAVVIFLLSVALYVATGVFPQQVFGLGLVALVVPFALSAFRVARGHYSDSLDEP